VLAADKLLQNNPSVIMRIKAAGLTGRVGGPWCIEVIGPGSGFATASPDAL
jgi:hypothetical protein